MKGRIYIAINKQNNKVYIGQTVCTIKYRKSKHKHDAYNINSPGYESKFYRSIRKYGMNNFEWRVVKDNIKLLALDKEEKKYIKVYDSYVNGYNSTEGGQKSRGTMSVEVREKISKSKMGQAPWNKGIPMSIEAKRKLSASKKGQRKGIKRPKYVIKAMMVGKKNAVLSDDSRKKMSDSHKGKILPECQRDKIAKSMGQKEFYVFDGQQIVGKWSNASKCAKDLNLQISNISKCLKGKRKRHGGFTFRYVEGAK